MKKMYLYALPALLLASCGGRQQADHKVADSGAVVDARQEAPAVVAEQYFLTADSVGPVRVGESVSSLPPVVPGLYDMMVITETPDAMAYSFLLGDMPQFTIYDFMQGDVDVIALEGDALAVNTPDGPLRIGDEFSKVLRLGGVESEWQGIDEDGIWYWKWNGIFFGVEETGLAPGLLEALCQGRRPPRASEFTPEVRIGYIGTGLPF